MLCLDTNLVSDFLVGEPAARGFLDARPREALGIAAVSLDEIYFGALEGHVPAGIDDLRGDLDDLVVLDLEEAAATEGARLQEELLRRGTPLSHRDAMIGGISRANGTTIATRDGDFLRGEVRDVLDVVEY